MKLDIIKIDKDLFIIKDIVEEWCLKVFDYPESSCGNWRDGKEGRKYHRVFADSLESANDLCYRAYKEYEDKKVEILSASLFLKHIVFSYEQKEFFRARDLLDTFVKEHKDFNDADYSVIIKYREFLQREQHHKEHIKVQEKIKEAITQSGRNQASWPMS